MGNQIKKLLKDSQIPDIQKIVVVEYFYKKIASELIKHPDKIETFLMRKY